MKKNIVVKIKIQYVEYLFFHNILQFTLLNVNNVFNDERLDKYCRLNASFIAYYSYAIIFIKYHKLFIKIIPQFYANIFCL